MSVSTKVLLAAGTAVVIGLSSAAMAQSKKSTAATTIGEGEAIMVSPKTGTVHGFFVEGQTRVKLSPAL